MNKTVGEAVDYARELSTWASTTRVRASVAILPPFVALSRVADALRGAQSETIVQLGAQNMHWEDSGPYTGEISPLMLRDAGVSLVEVGHFERRTHFGETDISVNRKIRSAVRHGLSVVVCIGEDQDTRDFGVVLEFLSIQLAIALHEVPAEALKRIVVAYEPGWAIGSGNSATTEQISLVVTHLRSRLAELHGAAAAASVRVVYGGSVTRENAKSYASIVGMDGLFIGRAASSDVADFVYMIESFCEHRAQR